MLEPTGLAARTRRGRYTRVSPNRALLARSSVELGPGKARDADGLATLRGLTSFTHGTTWCAASRICACRTRRAADVQRYLARPVAVLSRGTIRTSVAGGCPIRPTVFSVEAITANGGAFRGVECAIFTLWTKRGAATKRFLRRRSERARFAYGTIRAVRESPLHTVDAIILEAAGRILVAVFAAGAIKALLNTCGRTHFTVFAARTRAARPVTGRPACRACRPVASGGARNTIRMGSINFISICPARLVVVETARAHQAPASCIPAERITKKFTLGAIVFVARCGQRVFSTVFA